MSVLTTAAIALARLFCGREKRVQMEEDLLEAFDERRFAHFKNRHLLSRRHVPDADHPFCRIELTARCRGQTTVGTEC